MGEALLGGLLGAGWAAPADVVVARAGRGAAARARGLLPRPAHGNLPFSGGGYLDLNLAKQFPALVLFGNNPSTYCSRRSRAICAEESTTDCCDPGKKAAPPVSLGKLQERLRI